MKAESLGYEKIEGAVHVLLGTLLLIFCSKVRIPMYPVPFTLHTLAVSTLAAYLTPKRAFSSVFAYLLFQTLENPFWLFGQYGGYYIAFLTASYLIGKMKERRSLIVSLLSGHALVLFLGFVWLIPFIGPKAALIGGALIFIPSEILKILAVASLEKRR